MIYIFKGKLWDKTENSFEPISNVMIKLYRHQNKAINKASKSQIPQLIAESKTDEEGNFIFEINEKYSKGEEIQVDILCEGLPGYTKTSAHEKINFRSLTINPGRSKLKMESFSMGTITFLSIFSAA